MKYQKQYIHHFDRGFPVWRSDQMTTSVATHASIAMSPGRRCRGWGSRGTSAHGAFPAQRFTTRGPRCGTWAMNKGWSLFSWLISHIHTCSYPILKWLVSHIPIVIVWISISNELFLSTIHSSHHVMWHMPFDHNDCCDVRCESSWSTLWAASHPWYHATILFSRGLGRFEHFFGLYAL